MILQSSGVNPGPRPYSPSSPNKKIDSGSSPRIAPRIRGGLHFPQSVARQDACSVAKPSPGRRGRKREGFSPPLPPSGHAITADNLAKTLRCKERLLTPRLWENRWRVSLGPRFDYVLNSFATSKGSSLARSCRKASCASSSERVRM